MRCYFHLENDTSSIRDEDGIQVADLRDARAQARLAVAEVRDEEPDSQWWEGWKLKAVDAAGNLLFLLPLDISAAPRTAA